MEILAVFIFGNLMSKTQLEKEHQKIIIDLTLETLHKYVTSMASVRLFTETEVMRRVTNDARTQI